MVAAAADPGTEASPRRWTSNRQALALLLRTWRGRRGQGVGCARERLAAGLEVDCYEPRTPRARTFILLYGLDLAGERDARLVRFAHALAAGGYRVLVPALPGLKAYRLDCGDVAAIQHVVAHVAKAYGGSNVIVGFSAGGCLALTAACAPETVPGLNLLFLFSPPFDLPALWAALVRAPLRPPQREAEWDHFIWRQAVLAYHQQEGLRLDAAEREALLALLESYCEAPAAARKRAFYEQVLAPRGPLPLPSHVTSPEELAQLSPRGRLGDVRCRVVILHDAHDPLVPPAEGERIAAALRARKGPAPRLLVTPLLAHVNPRAMWRLRDVFSIVDMLGELFR